MMRLERAKEYLKSGNYTCVIEKDDCFYTSSERGVKPLVNWMESKIDFHGAYAADKVIGKATAFLYVLLGVTKVYAGVISQTALQVLQVNGISTEYGQVVEYIINRKKDGMCPFEAAVLEIDNPQTAYEEIRRKMVEMNNATESLHFETLK